DLATPQALGILWDSLKSEDYTPEEKWGLIEDAEEHLGLSLTTPPEAIVLNKTDMPVHIQNLLVQREAARESRDFATSDRLRGEIEKSGYHVDDGPNGPVLTKTTF
ncbi:MAG: hypothetical protein Q8L30_01865, partial [bacterium]|nr:hypothetical protein [bacterium]